MKAPFSPLFGKPFGSGGGGVGDGSDGPGGLKHTGIRRNYFTMQ
jgi:hypothetical protein